jgi:hypothetical protein
MNIHAAVGRRLGLTDDDIDKLLTLDPSAFPRGEWLALKFAQEWALLGGCEPSGELLQEYKKFYNARKRARIAKLLRIIEFANYWNNTFSRRPVNPGFEGRSPLHCRYRE